MVRSKAPSSNALHELGYKIFLDRYAQKDMTRSTLAVGDTVIVVVDSKTGQREIGTVKALRLPRVQVELLDGEVVERDVEHVDKPLETDPGQMMDRVAAGIAAVEPTPELRALWTERFRWLLDDWKFVPGGRILAAAGTDQELTFYNCMPPEQEILTASGYKPLGEVRVGDLVVTHRNRLRPVLHKLQRDTKETLYIIKPKKLGFDDLRVTGDHKILTIRSEWVNKHWSRDGLRLSQQPQWLPARELQVGDYLAVAYDAEECPPEPIYLIDYLPEIYTEQDAQVSKQTRRGAHGYVQDWATHFSLNNRLDVDSDLLYLFGRWLGDGCVTHRSQSDIPSGIKIVFAPDELAEAEQVASIIEAKFGITPSIKLSNTGHWYDLWANSMPLGQFFKAFLGVYSYGKRIPDILMHLPRELTTSLLRGLFSADGYTSGSELGIVLSNRVMAMQVHHLLLRLGYFFSIRENTHRMGKLPAYRVSAKASECGDLFSAFFDRTPPDDDGGVKAYLEYDGLRWVRIDDVETSDYRGVVMDIEVAEDHSFVSAGVVVSNCYVIPSPRDSRSGIIETLRQMTEIMSRGGGVGINISSLRPRHAYVKGVNGRSSGAVSWGALYSFVTGLIEQGGCFSPTARILTDKGLIPAQELAERLEQGETFYAQTHKGPRRITARFRNGVKPLFEVRTKRGYRVQVTEDHKIAVLMDGKVTTMALRYLRPGDEILLMLGEGVQGEYPRLRPVRYERSVMSTTLNTTVRLPEVLDEKLAYLIGYLYGDGYIHMGKKVNWRAPKAFRLATADDYPEIRERLMTTIEQVFGVKPSLVEGDGACKTIAVHSRLIIEWLNENGLLKPKAGSLRVPEVIFRSPSTVVGAFIAGYFDADGSDRGKKGGYGIDSVSYAMLQEVQMLLSANGVVAHIHSQDRSASGWRTIHRLVVTGAQFRQRFAAFVPAEKLKSGGQKRDMLNTYPASVWSALGARPKYRQRIYDGVSPRLSYNQLTAIRGQLLADAQVEAAAQIDDLMRVMPDTIVSITPLDAAETFDFEVEDVHLLSGDGIYTSNSRRGALMLILNDWHPDVFDFINSKRRMGQITNANISVGVSDRLMDAVKADGDWELMFPDTSYPDYDEAWDGDLDKWIADGRRVIHYRTVKARQVWDAIIESAWASAEPGVFFRERYNKMSNSWYYAPIICTNPCVTGDTRIYTDKGLISARELFEDETAFEVTVDGRFGLSAATAPSTRVFMTGRKPVYRLQTQEGYYVRATADHRFMTPSGWVALGDLRPGDKIHVLNRKGGFGVEGSLELGQALGWLAGAGAVEQDEIRVSFCGEDERAPSPLLAEHVNAPASPLTVARHTYAVGGAQIASRDAARVSSAPLHQTASHYGLADDKHQVPEAVFRGSEAMQRGFLQALFTANGSFQDGGEQGGSVRLAANVIELLEGAQQLLGNFGIASRIDRGQHPAGRQQLPELVISEANLIAFADEIGFLPGYQQAALVDYVSRSERGPYGEDFLATVEAVTADGVEEVFDLTEPLTHSFVANSLVVHNCGEQGLPAFGVCNLGAINLARFYDADKHDVDWEALDQTARYATRFLDNVIDSTLYFFEQNREQQLGERRVGLNNMGLAELMIRLGIRYGSDESVQFIDKLYSFLARAIYETSIELAREKGPFPQFNADKFLRSGFMLTMPDDIREKVRQYGIRNVTLTTQAPTGTTGTMVNTSTGIEPFFSWVYYRKSRLGIHEEQVPLVKEWFDAHPGVTKLPDYFVTAMDLSPEDHVRVQAAIQRWVDSSISKTCNVPRDYTVEQVRALYEYMYELGCKGGTIYRDGSRDEQVLMLKDDQKAGANGDVAPNGKPVEQVATPHRVYPRPKRLSGVTISRKTPFGTAYITMNSDEHGNPFEVFIIVGKAGSDLQADAEGLGRMLSLQLRTTAPQNRMEMLKLIIDQLQGIGGTRSVGMGPSRVASLPDAVAGALLEHYFPQSQAQQLGLPLGNGEAQPAALAASHSSSGAISGADMCPECGTVSLVRMEGCRKCLTCGYSEC